MSNPKPEIDAAALAEETVERILADWSDPDSGIVMATGQRGVRCADFAAYVRTLATQLAEAWRERDEAEAAKKHYHNRACDIADQRDRAESALAATRAELEGVREAASPECERECVATYLGGYSDRHDLAVLRHGMSTAFNVVRAALRPAAEPEVKP